MTSSGADNARRHAITVLLAARIADWTDEERAAMQAVVDALNPSARHLTDICDWLDEIAARDGRRPAAALDAPELLAVQHAPISAPERLKRWKEHLRRLRFPRLMAREQEIATAIAELDLGLAITLTAPRDLEGGVLTLTVRARSAGDLSAAVDRLRDAGTRSKLEQLFALLDAL